MKCGKKNTAPLEGRDMNRRMGTVIAVVVVLAGGLVLSMFMQQRALMAEVRADQWEKRDFKTGPSGSDPCRMRH